MRTRRARRADGPVSRVCRREALDVSEFPVAILRIDSRVDLACDVRGGARRLRMLHLLDAVARAGNDGYRFDGGGLRPGGVEVRYSKEAAQMLFKRSA